jgi:hypothetical protein
MTLFCLPSSNTHCAGTHNNAQPKPAQRVSLPCLFVNNNYWTTKKPTAQKNFQEIFRWPGYQSYVNITHKHYITIRPLHGLSLQETIAPNALRAFHFDPLLMHFWKISRAKFFLKAFSNSTTNPGLLTFKSRMFPSIKSTAAKRIFSCIKNS